MTETRRVVATGIGVLSPLGIGKERFWENSRAGKLALRRVSVGEGPSAKSIVAGRVEGFRAEDHVPPKIIKQTDRSTHLAIAACKMAAEDAGLDMRTLPANDIGMYFSTLFGGMEFAEPELYAQAHISPDRVSAYQAIAWFYAATQGQWSILNGLKGYAKTVVGDRAGGLQALAWAVMAIQQGHSKVMFAGGFDAPLVPYTLLIHKTSGLLSSDTLEPEDAYRPFHRDRSGTVLAEGAGILMLEDREHAIARNAPIYAELAGASSCCDRAPQGSQAAECRLADCIADTLERARIQPRDVDHVMAEGVGTQADDAAEADALHTAFGARQPTVSAPKSLTGHMLSAAGPIDCAWACLMMRHNVVLPTASLSDPDPALHLRHVFQSGAVSQLNTVLCLSRGYGGTNAALVLRRAA